ncbi:MAG: peptide chain release factor N(5)-glutamine methyltransferase [Sediminibacterium sp.]|jgi:release factor glutamine methyltransferase|nr:peptide chain release factor N(5)-glutamine methyltransferase [Sediminibacterium sp.]MBP6144325.1 peptide chain release factor N(5)-glutamine methyltransferase [Sediminibacterium sp.]
MSLNDIKQALKKQLEGQYETVELNPILSILIEHITGWDQLHQALHKDSPVSEDQAIAFEAAATELLAGRPIQYITGKAWFMGEAYQVNEHVLIPRPETEELVDWIVEYAEIKGSALRILDIGTGSGCIAIALKKALPEAIVTAIDISPNALKVAANNASALKAEIEFVPLDILNTAFLPGQYDVIVSNPPYIPMQEMKNMELQVTAHEPNIALFVPDEDPLVFYKAIARLAKLHLTTNGQLFFEIHYDQGEAMVQLLDEMHFHAELREDLFGKDRMIRASLKPR